MNFSLLPLILTVVGGLIVAGLVAWIRRSRLGVLVPRTFVYSQLSEQGQLVELSVFNRGFKTEHEIDVRLNRNLSYEIIGSNTEYAQLDGDTLHVARIGFSSDATVLLLVEDGTFKPDDIVECLSRDTKGKIVSNLTDIPITGQQRIGLVVTFICFALVIAGAYYAFNSAIGSSKSQTAETTRPADTINVRGWSIPSNYKLASVSLLNLFQHDKINVTIMPVARHGKWVTVPFLINNNTKKVIKVSVRMVTAASSQQQKSYELSSGELVIVPNQSTNGSIKVIVPTETKSQAERTIYVSGFIEDFNGKSLSIKKQLVVN